MKPLGPKVDTTPAPRPARVTLRGRFVTLVPLDAAAHAAAIHEQTRGPENDDLWAYLSVGPFASLEPLTAVWKQREASEDPFFFTILDNATSTPVGCAAYMRIDPGNRVIEAGHILFAPALQRSPGATEAMYLMARHAFEDLGYRRYEWKCNALHTGSRNAALRLGFQFEGLFRRHMIVKGHSRDTAWFAMIDADWPVCKAAFEGWLAPENFDESGRQRKPLASFRPDTYPRATF